MKKIKCPFTVGDRIIEEGSGCPAVVTKITKRGFKYIYDQKKSVVPRLGLVFDGGECYELGYKFYKLIK